MKRYTKQTNPAVSSVPPNIVALMQERWLSVDEIAAYLGIKRDTVYKWIEENGCLLIELADIGSFGSMRSMNGYGQAKLEHQKATNEWKTFFSKNRF